MKIHSLEEATAVLKTYVPKVAEYTGDGMSLDRMWPLLKAVGSPEKKLKAIHIAGTSGKTSTSYYIAATLQQSGLKTGLTVSPHVDSITERLQIDGKPVSAEFFCSELGEFLELIADTTPTPSYFELLIVFVFWVFVRAGVDYAVIETGLGGLLDGTNVLQSEDKICVITDIGYDHTAILGNTLSKIAAQKAGIIHEHNHVYMFQQSDEIMEQVRLRVDEKLAYLYALEYETIEKGALTKTLPEFQQRNWLLAEHVCRAMASRDNFVLATVDPNTIIIPGRMDTMHLMDGTTLLMDGAHNEQKMETFVRSFQSQYPAQKAVVLLALKQGKEYKSVIDALAPIQTSIILTTFNTSQDMPAVSQDSQVIARYCQDKKIDVVVIDNFAEATHRLLEQDSQIKIITGSFYLLGQVRHLLHDESVIV